MGSVIKISQVMYFKHVRAVDGVDLNPHEGELLVLHTQNGAGKTNQT